jgi:hypothetical protein
MALTPHTDLGSIAPVRDPCWYELRCSGYRITAPVAAVFTIVLVQNPDSGMSFTLVLPTASVTFVWTTAAADDSGTQVQVGGDAVASLANLLAALNSNYWVRQLFSVTSASSTITLTARNTGALVASLANTTPITMAFAEATAGSDGEFAEYYTANIRIWVERVWGSGTYTPLPAYDARPDEDRLCRWDVGSLLRPYVAHQWPAYASASPLLLVRLQARYYVDRWETDGDPPTPQRVYATTVRQAWYCGSRNLEHNSLLQLLGFVRRSDVPTPWLTYRGRRSRHTVSPAQQHYLGWYRSTVKVANQQLRMAVVVTYQDNSTQSTSKHVDTNGSGFDQGMVQLYPTGWNILGLDALAGTDPVKYAVRIENHLGTALSEWHTFYLAEEDANELHLEFVSSLGVVESVRLKGAWEHGMSTEFLDASRWRPLLDQLRPSLQESDHVHHLLGAQRTRKASTGYMPRWELEALADLLVSPELRLVDHERGTRLPVRLVSGQALQLKQQGTEEEHLYTMNLELLCGDPEMAWSNTRHMPPEPTVADPGGDDV